MSVSDPDENKLPLSKCFNEATEQVQKISGTLTTEQLLYFYARYKQTIVGACNTVKPSFFDFQARSKWSSWKNLGNMSADQAMREYVEELRKLNPVFNSSPDVIPKSKNNIGPVHSVLANCDEPLSDNEKTAFDCVKDCNVEMLKLRLKDLDINGKDDDGMTLLHWASDRNHLDIISLLIQHGASLNTQDNEGQTALHYAYSCEHREVIDLLLSAGADTTICDHEGNLPDTA